MRSWAWSSEWASPCPQSVTASVLSPDCDAGEGRRKRVHEEMVDVRKLAGLAHMRREWCQRMKATQEIVKELDLENWFKFLNYWPLIWLWENHLWAQRHIILSKNCRGNDDSSYKENALKTNCWIKNAKCIMSHVSSGVPSICLLPHFMSMHLFLAHWNVVLKCFFLIWFQFAHVPQ